MSGTVYGDFTGTLTDATPGSYYTLEIDTNNDQMSDVSGSAYPGSFGISGSLPLGTTSVQARAMEYVSTTGQYVYGNWQQFTITGTGSSSGTGSGSGESGSASGSGSGSSSGSGSGSGSGSTTTGGTTEVSNGLIVATTNRGR